MSETTAPQRAPTLPGLPASRRRVAVPLPLVVLLVFAFVQGLAWSAMTLPFHGADEPAHIAYVQHLAETGHGPNELRGTGSISTELARAEYELNLRPIFAHQGGRPTWSDVRSVSKQLEDIPDAQRKNGSGPNAVAQNPPLYYAYQSLVYLGSPDQSLFGRLFSLRAANVLLYVLAIALAWLAAAELSPRTWVRFLATAVVALQPKLASLAGNINPDTLLVTLSAAFLLAGLRLLRLGPSIGRVALVALCAGLGVLTHGRGLFFVPPAVIVVAVALLRARPPRRVTLGAIGAGGAILLAGLAGAFEWTRSTAGGAGAFGGEVGRAAQLSFDPLQFFEYVWQFYLPRLPGMGPMLGPPYGFRQVYVDTFFGGYANLEVGFAGRTSSALHALLLAGLLALAVMAVVRRRELWSHWPVVLLAVSTVGSLLALLHISSYRHMQVGGDPLLTGRYLLPLLPVAGLAVAWLVARLPARLRAPAAAIVLAGLVLLDIKGFLVNAERFYS